MPEAEILARRFKEANIQRFWARVNRTDGCWIWTGKLSFDGYGRLSLTRDSVAAHRYAYELLVGPIPDGLTIDHLCRVRSCVNPAHLEAVTNRVNVLERSQNPRAIAWRTNTCLRGHPLSGDNIRIRVLAAGQRRRICRKCDARRHREAALRRTEREA